MSNTKQSKIWTILSHEYITKVKSKGFIISTLLGPLFLIIVIAVPVVIALMTGDQTAKKIAIVDETKGNLGTKIVNSAPDKYFLSTESINELRKKVVDKELDGYLVLPSDIVKTGDATAFTSGGGGIGFLNSLESAVGKVVRKERMVQSGADSNVIKLVEKGVNIHTQKVTEKGVEKDYTAAYAGLGYFLGLMIYMMMFLYGSFVMRGVIEEKANRIIEIIASSARPIEILYGKVIGIGAVGLTQVVFWIIISSVLMAAAGPIVGMFNKPEVVQAGMQMAQSQQNFNLLNEIPSISIWLVMSFVFYFLCGYFIYASLFAAVGSAVDQENDAQQLMMPVTMPIIIPILFIGNVISNPDGTLATVLSLFPLFTPILMIVRIAATNVPLWQIALSVVLEILTFMGVQWVAARIYRTGILMYGKKPSFKDIFKWIRIAK